MRRYRYSYGPSSYSFGPGGISPAIKALIWINVGVFVLTTFAGRAPDLQTRLFTYFGLAPEAVFERFWIWQPFTYLFLHGGFTHILFNMLGLWMFGVQLERRWGTRFFLRYYFITGVGAGVSTLIASLLPFLFGGSIYYTPMIGASGALYGVLLAFALYYPDVRILVFLLFPIPARYFVMIFGGMAFLMSFNTTGSGGGVAHTAHLGGMLFGYLYLTRGRVSLGWGRVGLKAELKYRYLKWRMNRLRRKFEVHSGGRKSDWDRRIH